MVQTDIYNKFVETIPKINSQDRVRHSAWKKASFNNMRFPYLDYVGVQMSCLCWTGSMKVSILILLPVWIKPLQLLNWEMKNHKYFPMTLKYESSINLIKWQMLRHIASNADKWGVSFWMMIKKLMVMSSLVKSNMIKSFLKIDNAGETQIIWFILNNAARQVKHF